MKPCCYTCPLGISDGNEIEFAYLNGPCYRASDISCSLIPCGDTVTRNTLPATIRLLCVDDNPNDTELLAIALERADPQCKYVLHCVEDGGLFSEALQDEFDVVLCDFDMPRFS